MTMSLSAVFSLWILVILRQHFSDNQASPPPSAPGPQLISSVPIQKLREEKVSSQQNSYPCHTFNVIQDCQSLRENNGFSLNMAICQYFAGNRDLGLSLRDYHGSGEERFGPFGEPWATVELGDFLSLNHTLLFLVEIRH